MERVRKTIFYKRYFLDFFESQRLKVKKRITWTLDVIETVAQVPEQYLKHLEGTDGLYEIRVQAGSDIFRIFCFFDKGKLVVLMNGFHKKTMKTPPSEIEKALKIKKEYENSK
ncbi:type II toxin-antitoxin system RelE/ParE family toxin [Mucilaginibacter sp. L3T2-6]|uniref:type II toxin-antitoxin system RelE/ParE family toxin n=1 Tax=Mucilaginibacter sp. L3T2-6 TaxID=3062491 RepID=UPI0026754695|nr:type II toxin-antitoxin system RelE/ParE family toxin [Mucilaginibacter sp. L3T2-6]MDO3643152.1 type II toxin-antitoxin system RelE/ParE family toxin [Mucilaginibacter sp. L3T2-6]MDV6215476.1 type II toxin-antitoxin system RelE/ParE family toxin [Mucilaginibacter sp. L3T2-6]